MREGGDGGGAEGGAGFVSIGRRLQSTFSPSFERTKSKRTEPPTNDGGPAAVLGWGREGGGVRTERLSLT